MYSALTCGACVQLCKSIVLVNVHLPPELPDFGTPHASRYVCAIVQYTRRLNTDKLRRQLLHAHKVAGGSLPGKAFNLRLCPEEVRRRWLHAPPEPKTPSADKQAWPGRH